ncbi:MAG TPA: c-type cytochrome [Thermoleophilaceae bacterium]|nr:c-type cytochrome [Thermoleophilaceae bacterium]
MRPSGHSSAVALALAAAATLPLAGCGRQHDADLANGKALFVQKCASCHTLKRANASGVQGPNLDDAFSAARAAGMTAATVRGVVRHQISNARRDSIMPRNLVTGNDANDVASYVGAVAGQGGQDTGALAAAGAPKVSNKPVAEKGGKLQINADPTGALAFTAKFATAKPGAVTLVMANQASIQHDISIQGNGVNKQGPRVGKGGTSKVSASLKPGKYTFYCSVPGHEAGGMKGTLTVK